MRSATIAVATALAGVASAQCPAVWTQVASDLKAVIVDSSGVATDDARASIRMIFHDCFPEACDGSLILASECTDRTENSQMTGMCSTVGDVAAQNNVSYADTIQLAGGKYPSTRTGTNKKSDRAPVMGIAAALGPSVSFKVGRTDSSTANPEGMLPAANATADSIIDIFTQQGFSSTELVALIGSHSAAKNLDGQALDSTVDDLDLNFYKETIDGTAPFTLPSDANLKNSSTTGSDFSNFAQGSLSDWQSAFVSA